MKLRFLLFSLAGLFSSSSLVLSEPVAPDPCSVETLDGPSIFGASILNWTASKQYNRTVLGQEAGAGAPKAYTVSYCGVNITYTHPGWDDTINVEIWLPLQISAWNGRFQGTGGGGWATGDGAPALAQAVANGYSAASTDGGHSITNSTPANWALLSPGNVNLHLLDDFASVALSDMTLFGQAITEAYYQQPASHSYWTGCSTGGRQGLMLAQRYPNLYDGILAQAPAINWDSFIVAEFWPALVMSLNGTVPEPCELDAFTAAAIAACDKLDGVEDGVIGDDDACEFDPFSVVGQTYTCQADGESKQQELTAGAAAVVSAAWTGPVDDTGRRRWYGLNREASLRGLVGTAQTSNGSFVPVPFPIADDWIRYFIAKNPTFDPLTLTEEQYFEVLRQSRNRYSSIIGTSDPDLSAFSAQGGKLISWHGLADQLIFPNGTREYYERVSDTLLNVQDFFRYFEAPGVAHCSGGPGFQPTGQLEALVNWVENAIAPDTLLTVNATEPTSTREICPWPKRQTFRGGNPSQSTSFACE
ncbi:Tannase and feruloyl esterase-like protein 3 [Elsinoe fawcettii]|nr:Tannase and feruloyl esterase-like protein 3 [Elsinoe fawcettii]